MKFFSLEHEYLDEIIGPCPQSEGMSDYYDYKKQNSIRNLGYDKSGTPDLDAIKLVKGARLADLLSVALIPSLAGKIVSNDLKSLLLNFKLPSHHFFEAKVVDHLNLPLNQQAYYLFRVSEHQNQYINFDRSEFYIHRRGVGKIDSINIQCAEDLEKSPREQGLEAGHWVAPLFITLYPEAQFDIFCFRRFADFFVSENLKNAIESASLTGMRFAEPDFPIIQRH